MAQHATATSGIDTVGLRLSVVYGAGRLRGYMSYASHLVRQAALGGPVAITAGQQHLNWQYVEEVASTVVHVLEHESTGGGRTFNSHGVVNSYGDAGRVLARLRPALEIAIGDDLDPALNGVVTDYDDSELNRHFGYTPQWTFEDGLRATLENYEQMAADDPATALS